MMMMEHDYGDGDVEAVLLTKTENTYLCQTVNVISFCLFLCLFTERNTFTEGIYYNYVKCCTEWTIR